MGCWTTIKSFHVKIILLDKQELIQEIQVHDVMTHNTYMCNLYVEKKSTISWLLEHLNMLIVILMRDTDTIIYTLATTHSLNTFHSKSPEL